MSEEARREEGHRIELFGGSMVFKATGEDHFAAEITAGPGFAPRPHIHRRHEEIFYVIEGCFEFLVGDEVLRADAGKVLVVPPGTLHDFRNPGPGSARLLGIATPGGFHAYFEEINSQVVAGTLTADSLHELRLRYDTDEVDLAWSP